MFNRFESGVPLKSIVSVFRKPDIKAQLDSQVRYDRYRMSETPDRFAQLLGPDVRFISHPGVTYKLTKEFIEAQNTSGTGDILFLDEADMLLTAALSHDWGEFKFENMGHGDVTFEEHGQTHEQTEGVIFERVLGKIDSIADRFFIREVYRHVVQNRESRLGRMFNAIERIGYLKTGLRAYQGFKGERIENWAGLAGNVLSNQVSSLLKYAADYPYVRTFLEENSDLISKAFTDISGMEIPPDNRGKPSFYLDKFLDNREAWQQALTSS